MLKKLFNFFTCTPDDIYRSPIIEESIFNEKFPRYKMENTQLTIPKNIKSGILQYFYNSNDDWKEICSFDREKPFYVNKDIYIGKEKRKVRAVLLSDKSTIDIAIMMKENGMENIKVRFIYYAKEIS